MMRNIILASLLGIAQSFVEVSITNRLVQQSKIAIVPKVFDKLTDIKIGQTDIPTGHNWFKASITSGDVRVTCADEVKDV